MKAKIFLISVCSVAVLTVGVATAYYNTKSLGFDDDVKIIYSDSEKINIMDYSICYKDIDDAYSKLSSVIPKKVHRLTQHNVPCI